MPEIAELTNGGRVEIPEGQDPPTYLHQVVIAAYQAGAFGPVAGNRLETPGAGEIARNALKAAARPGDVVAGAVQRVTGEPDQTVSRPVRRGIDDGRVNGVTCLAASSRSRQVGACRIRRPPARIAEWHPPCGDGNRHPSVPIRLR